MKTHERVVIYAALTALLAWNGTMMLGRSGTSAFAGPASEAQDLGPADAVTLAGPDGAKDLVLVNRAGRLAWGEPAYDRAYSHAYVFIGTILKQLMQSEARQEDRERLGAELSEKEDEYRQQIDAVGQRLQSMDPGSPEAQAVYEQGSALYQEYMNWLQQEALVRRGKLDAEHLESAYREMIEAVEVIAERRGIDTIHRFIPPGEAFEAENPDQAMMAIRLRSLLRYPDDLDITDAVLEELSLVTE